MKHPISAVCASWQVTQKGPVVQGIAILSAPGLYDVIAFVSPDGAHRGNVWSYDLHFANGCMVAVFPS